MFVRTYLGGVSVSVSASVDDCVSVDVSDCVSVSVDVSVIATFKSKKCFDF